ncbi:MAG: hypothetical protein R2762_18940 [Bryobacteraceae bacterium]
MKLRHGVLSACLAVSATPLAMGQGCAGSQDFFGPYVFVASRGVPDPTVAMPMEGAAQPNYSATPMGQLAKGAASGAAFAVVGRVTADGLGNLFGGPPDVEQLTVRVGTYTVNGDCTLAVTLVDGFRSGLDLLGDPLPGARVAYQGVLRNRGDEATFVQTGQGKGTVIELFRPQLAANCTQTTLSGVHGLAITGLALGTEEMPAIQPLALMGRLNAENGAFKLDLVGMESRQPARQFTGSYQVQPDCTGAGELIFDGEKMKISFVLARNGVQLGAFRRAEMRIVVQDAKRIGTGIAR